MVFLFPNLGCIKKLEFHGVYESCFASLSKAAFRNFVLSAPVVQITPYAAAIKMVARVGFKSIPIFSMISTPVALIGSILSLFFFRFSNIKKLLACALYLLSIGLGTALIISSPSLKLWKILLLSMYIYTFIGSLGTIPTLFAIKYFSPSYWGSGLGLVSILSSFFMLICHLLVDLNDGLEKN